MGVVIGLLAAGPAWPMFDIDKGLVASSKIGLQDAIKSAIKTVPGKAAEAKLGQDDRRTVWKIGIIDDISKNQTIYVDTQTGMAKRANCPKQPRYSGRSSADAALAMATHFMPSQP